MTGRTAQARVARCPLTPQLPVKGCPQGCARRGRPMRRARSAPERVVPERSPGAKPGPASGRTVLCRSSATRSFSALSFSAALRCALATRAAWGGPSAREARRVSPRRGARSAPRAPPPWCPQQRPAPWVQRQRTRDKAGRQRASLCAQPTAKRPPRATGPRARGWPVAIHTTHRRQVRKMLTSRSVPPHKHLSRNHTATRTIARAAVHAYVCLKKCDRRGASLHAAEVVACLPLAFPRALQPRLQQQLLQQQTRRRRRPQRRARPSCSAPRTTSESCAPYSAPHTRLRCPSRASCTWTFET